MGHTVRRVERNQRQQHIHGNLDRAPGHDSRHCNRNVDARRRAGHNARFWRMVGGKGGDPMDRYLASERHWPIWRVHRHVELERRSQGERAIRRPVRHRRADGRERHVGERRAIRSVVHSRGEVRSAPRHPMLDARHGDPTRRLPQDVTLAVAAPTPSWQQPLGPTPKRTKTRRLGGWSCKTAGSFGESAPLPTIREMLCGTASKRHRSPERRFQ